MKNTTLTEDKAEQTPTGGVLVGKRKGQTIIHDKGTMSGYLVGKTHAEGGIKAVNKSTGQPLEMQGGEVVITAPAVSDQTKNEFNGKMMTNREILSQINVNGGGVAFADGGDIPKKIKRTGASYNYGGRTMTDHEIYKYITGGGIAEDLSIRDIANIHQIPLDELKEEVRIGMLAESEHKGNKKDQMEIVKDHLLENPKYYTLLEKAGLVEETDIPVEKSKWLRQFYVTNNPSIDKLLKDLQPKINELIEKQKELVIKESTKIFGEPRPMTELDVQFYEAGLIFKMVQSFNKYLKNTDELYDVSIDKRGDLFEVNGKVKRDGRTYKFSTELISAGGYNIQEYHYRYIIKTDLPSSNENSAVENIKAKMGVLKKIRTIDEDIERYSKYISNDEKELRQGFREYKIQGIENKRDLSDLDVNSNKKRIQNFKKEIEKLEGKKSDLVSVLESLDKKGVGVNFGKQVKEAIGRRILVDRLVGSKYKETGNTLDFKIDNRSIRGAKIDERTYENLGTINTFSFVDEGNGLCTMKAGLELRGKYTPYAEYKNLPIKEIPYKINEIFNGDFSKYLEYENGGEVEKALNDLEKTPSVSFWNEPEFDGESYFFEKEGKPNSFVNLQEDDISKTILAYDEEGKLVGVFKIRTWGDLKGAFKIVVREDARSKGWGKKLLNEAEKQNIDIVNNVKNNSFSSNGRTLLRSWLNQKLKKYDKGGQMQKEDLVRDSKSGNTPARDLNNYNDVLDVDADGVVGAETGLYANGGDVDFDVDGTGGADASSGVGAFEDGGEVDEYAEGGEVTNPMVSNWDNINSSWKDTSKVKKIVWANNPYDKGLYSIVAPYLGKDELRPVMSGINFDENGITATNAHVLITLPYPNKKYEGIYEPDLSKRKDSEQITIDGKYPNYSAVIPFSDDTKHFLIDVYKLLQYTNVAMKYANKITHAIGYKINNEVAGFNGRFMAENLKTLLKLGHEKVYAHYIAPKKAMVLSPSKDYRVGNDEILLVMPVMLMNEKLGANDIDYGRELSVYFDFDDNEIHNADGSVADFKMKYENNSPVDVEDVNLVESMVKKNKTLNILNYVVVKDNTLRVTNLKADYVFKNISLPDGIYLPSNGNLEITMNPIDDYPREAVFVSDEDTIEFTIPSTVFEYYIDRFKFVLDQDDLRPIFKGISLKHTSDNKLFLLGTDSHLGLKIDITKYVDIPLYNREIQTVIDPLWLFAFLDKLEEGALHIKSNKVATIIDSESKSFYCKNVDGNYPNLEAVIPQESDDLVSIEYSALKKCLNNEFMKNYKKQTDKYEMVGVFDKDGELFVGRRSKQVTNPEFKDVEKLCDIKFESSKYAYRYDGQSVLLAMPLIAEQQDNFIFDEELLSKVMTIVNDSVIQMHHNGTKRAFLIPIHSFEYEKTTIEHKTREQKPTIEQEQMIAEVEEIDEIKEAIEVMQMLLETAPKKDKKEILEAIEVMEMLLESYQN
jgi:GNAT superfamily N-acetyltransferase